MRGWFVVVFALAGCPYTKRTTSAPEQVVALEGINTPYDDFNAAKPVQLEELIYSTSRGSEGKHLDVYEVRVWWDRNPRTTGEPRPFHPALMSEGNERGPLIMRGDTFGGNAWDKVLVLASDRGGTFDLYWSVLSMTPELVPLANLNSPANDAYLSLPYPNATSKSALFASDRDGGGYDIYEATWSNDDKLDGPARITRVTALSSDADDSAPYVDAARELLVFASNRHGNWDLYCSKRASGAWSEPRSISFNTSHDEFRPSLLSIGSANFMVFSSNRPGGAGGYDLYVARFDDC